MSNMGPISEEKFAQLTAKAQRSIMYGYLLELNLAIKKRERERWYDRIEAFLGGIVGGVIAVTSKMIFWR